ncbi:MAG TPA: hypothetical protein VM936_08855 [Pyrinomonadaceae bacterium]|nr:hypothetical protein [Pyrinomonadaceae bacterium]
MLFGSTALEVAVGMIFVYLLLSLLCSAVVEYIEAKLNYRARDLERGLRLLLDQKVPKELSYKKLGTTTNTVAEHLYAHPLVKALYRGEKPPSYIPARTFSLALWDMVFPAAERAGSAGGAQSLKKIRDSVQGNTLIGDDLRKAVLTLIDDAEGDFEKARKNIEDWYDGTMDRVSGWYKRRVHVVLLVLGLLVAAVVNADTINIAKAFMRNDALRQSVVAQAEKAAAAPTPQPTPTPADPAERARLAAQKVSDVKAQIDTLGLPIGWVSDSSIPDDPRRLPGTPGDWALKILGLLITALAISQGAPFWFDLLNKIIVIRSTVKPKEKSPDQPSKDKPAPATEKKKPDDHDQP